MACKTCTKLKSQYSRTELDRNIATLISVQTDFVSAVTCLVSYSYHMSPNVLHGNHLTLHKTSSLGSTAELLEQRGVGLESLWQVPKRHSHSRVGFI